MTRHDLPLSHYRDTCSPPSYNSFTRELCLIYLIAFPEWSRFDKYKNDNFDVYRPDRGGPLGQEPGYLDTGEQPGGL